MNEHGSVRNTRSICRVFDTLGLIALIAGSIGCSILFGTIRPVSERATNYTIDERVLQSWQLVDPESLFPGMHGSAAEVAYRSRKTGATIVLHTSCEALDASSRAINPRELSKELFRGIDFVNIDEEIPVQIGGENGLRILAHSKPPLQATVLIEAVVVAHGMCTFDFLYFTLKSNVKEAQEFNRYWKSLQFKRD